MAATLSEADMADLAALLFGPDTPSYGRDRTVQAASLANGLPRRRHRPGRALVRRLPRPAGAGNPGAAYAAIGGQHAAYVALQLRAYKSGARATDPNQMMRAVAAKLTDDEIDAVASYVQGLR